MKISRPKLILNPYDWLPGYGESKVSFRSIGVDIIIEIEYERDVLVIENSETVQNFRRYLFFKSVNSFVRMPFPGVGLFEFCGDSSKFRLGELTEFLDSEWASPSMKVGYPVSAGCPQHIRHFSIQFLSENIAFHVLAENVSLSEEQLMV